MTRAPLPPGARDVIAKRERGHLLNDIYVACGWPSNRLRRVVTPRKYSAIHPSLYDAALAIGTPETAKRYQWQWLVGLSVLLWAESPTQATILRAEVAPLILASHPRLLQLWLVYDGQHEVIEFLKLSEDSGASHAD